MNRSRQNPTGGLVLALVSALVLVLGSAGCAEPEKPVELLGEPPLPSDMSQLDPAVGSLVDSHVAKIAADPTDAGAWSRLAMAYQANELMELAESCWEQSLARDPLQAEAWYHRARCAESLGEPESAVAHIARSIELDATYPPSWWRKGDWELELGRVADAERSFAEAVELAPEDPQGPIGLARVRIEAGDAEAAIGLLEQVVQSHPGEAYARYLLGNAYRTLGRDEEARAELGRGFGSRIIRNDVWGSELVPLRVAFGSRVQLATEYMNDGQLEPARALFESLRQERPDDVRVLTKLAQIYLRQERQTEAFGVLYDALQRHPENATVHLELTAAFTVTGDHRKAMEHVDRSIELNPAFGLAHARKATLYNRIGKTAEAAASFREALKYDPSEYRLWQSLGDCQAKLRRWDEAARSYEQALRTERKNPELFALFGLAALQAGRLAESEQALQQSLALAPREKAQVEKLLQEVRRRRAAAGSG